jgi:hypothetical protein
MDRQTTARALRPISIQAVAAGVAAGAVVAYGVGDYVRNVIAEMPRQWYQHGALGIPTDFGAAGRQNLG